MDNEKDAKAGVLMGSLRADLLAEQRNLINEKALYDMITEEDEYAQPIRCGNYGTTQQD